MQRLCWIGAGVLLFPFALAAQFAFYDSLNGVYWSQIEPPSYENFTQCQIVRDGLGYVLSATGSLYEFDAARAKPWRRLPMPEPDQMRNFFAFAADNIYAIATVPQLYKFSLLHWNGATWSPILAPHVNNIRDFLFASPQEA